MVALAVVCVLDAAGPGARRSGRPVGMTAAAVTDALAWPGPRPVWEPLLPAGRPDHARSRPVPSPVNARVHATVALLGPLRGLCPRSSSSGATAPDRQPGPARLKSKYKRSALGWLWSLLNPGLTLLIYTLVFGTFLRHAALGGNGGLNSFALFLFAALVVWNFFNAVVVGSMAALGAPGPC